MKNRSNPAVTLFVATLLICAAAGTFVACSHDTTGVGNNQDPPTMGGPVDPPSTGPTGPTCIDPCPPDASVPPTQVADASVPGDPDASQPSQDAGCPLDAGDEPNGTVTLCHIPPGNPAKAHTITVGSPAADAHLRHGDYLGDCR